MAKRTKKIKYVPYQDNPRQISEQQLEQLEDTLRRLGDLSGIIYNRRSKQFIGGNQRSKVIKFDDCELIDIKRFAKPDKQGTTAIGYVIWEGHRYNFRETSWNEKTEREANIVANKGGGDWDMKVLQEHFKKDDLIEWGFKEEELKWNDKPSMKASNDFQVKKSIKTDIKAGDIIEFKKGNFYHRLMCGDSTTSKDVELLMNGSVARLSFNDPPYDIDNEDYQDNIKKYTKNAHVFLMHEDRKVVKYLKKSTLEFVRFYVANFGFASPRGNDPYLQHILISQEKNGNAIPHVNLHDSFRSIIKMDYRHRLKDDKTIHAHQKSIDFISLFIKHFSKRSFNVLDLFGGSGTTMIVCHSLGRQCFVMEMNEQYCQVIIDRMIEADPELKVFKNKKDITARTKKTLKK